MHALHTVVIGERGPEGEESRCVMEWQSRRAGNGHGKQIINDYGRRAEGDERSALQR